MKREEAIKKWEDYLNKKKDELLIAETRQPIGKYADGKHRANCITIYQNLIKLVEQVVEDFKSLDETKYHKVSEEGLPTEEGKYLCCCFEEDEEYFYFVLEHKHLEDLTVIAWQKITPYEG